MTANNAPKTAAAPLVAILAADNEFHEELPNQFPVFPEAKDLVFGERPVREQSATLNAALQIGYFILGVRAAGLAAGPMTGFDAAGIEKDFFPDGDHSVLVVVNIGKPARTPRTPRPASGLRRGLRRRLSRSPTRVRTAAAGSCRRQRCTFGHEVGGPALRAGPPTCRLL